MFLDSQSITDTNYDEKIVPFIRNGIIIDTSVIDILIRGLISTRVTKKRIEELPDYKGLLDFLDLIKVNNRWEKFFITPQILTEVCTHLRNTYNKHLNYKNIISQVLPLLSAMGEELVTKHEIINRIDFENPIIEVGDISIYAVTETFLNSDRRIAILAKDRELNNVYKDSQDVMIMDYTSIVLNYS